MHEDSIQAYLRLSNARPRSGSWDEQRIEEALDIILRQPNKTGDPRYIARNALKDAKAKLKLREEIVVRRAH